MHPLGSAIRCHLPLTSLPQTSTSLQHVPYDLALEPAPPAGLARPLAFALQKLGEVVAAAAAAAAAQGGDEALELASFTGAPQAASLELGAEAFSRAAPYAERRWGTGVLGAVVWMGRGGTCSSRPGRAPAGVWLPGLAAMEVRAVPPQRETGESPCAAHHTFLLPTCFWPTLSHPPPTRTFPYRPRQVQYPPFPTTTIGSFPQTPAIRRARLAYKKGRIRWGQAGCQLASAGRARSPPLACLSRLAAGRSAGAAGGPAETSSMPEAGTCSCTMYRLVPQ
jgi:hypothetical protein